MRGGPRSFPQGFPCPVVLWILPGWLWLRIRGSHPLRPVFPGPFSCLRQIPSAVRTPPRTRAGLGSSHFARRYFGNRCFFLFLALLRCFSSGGSPHKTMDSSYDAWRLSMRVSPFGYLRIKGYVLLPAAFRSLSRPSSALSAKASTLRSFCVTIPVNVNHSVGLLAFCFLPFSLGRKRSDSSFIVCLSHFFSSADLDWMCICGFQGS